MDCVTLVFSGHAVRRMFERGIGREEVRHVVQTSHVIAAYPEDHPFPSVLLLGYAGGRPLHVVLARDPVQARCFVVTCYEPDPTLWTDDFTTRRTE